MDGGELHLKYGLAWHYTTEARARSIIRSSCIEQVSNGNSHVPLVWFSLDQEWEKSANGFIPGYNQTLFDLARCNQLWRFGVHPIRLTLWADLRINFNEEDLEAFENIARNVGSNPDMWMCTEDIITTSEIEIIERYNPEFHDWEEIHIKQDFPH